jgi:N-acetylglucosaminyldiphosphoundecaprenol N-acetyl-beta-D-mannosaminyltransferase
MNAPSSPLAAVRPPIAILGVPFDNVTTADTLRLIGEMIASGKPHYLVTANVDFLVQAQTDPELRRILLDAHLVVADGMPLVWASRWLGNPLPERVTGSGMTPLLLAMAEAKGWRVFFLGGTEQSVEQARVNTLAKHPKLQLKVYSPPFGRLVDEKDDNPMNKAEIERRLKEARPDILLVAFGCPKQERWIYENYRSMDLKVPVSIGVGATIDFLAGTMRRAPVWMQKTGLEWLYRMAQEPRRLFRRYAVGMWVFGWAILGQVRHTRARRAQTRSFAPASVKLEKSTATWRITLPTQMDAVFVAANAAVLQQIIEQPAHVLLDASGLEGLDSSGVGLLVRIRKSLHELGFQLVLVAPTKRLLEMLKLLKFSDYFQQAADEAAALKLLGVPVRASIAVSWEGEVTAANLDEVKRLTLLEFVKAHAGDTFVVNLTKLRFIDTSGIGLMVKLRNQAREQKIEVLFIGAFGIVLENIRKMRMEEFLFGTKS